MLNFAHKILPFTNIFDAIYLSCSFFHSKDARPLTTSVGTFNSASAPTVARPTTTTDGRVLRCRRLLRRWASPRARRASILTPTSWRTTTTWATSASPSSHRPTATTSRTSSFSPSLPTTGRRRPQTGRWTGSTSGWTLGACSTACPSILCRWSWTITISTLWVKGFPSTEVKVNTRGTPQDFTIRSGKLHELSSIMKESLALSSTAKPWLGHEPRARLWIMLPRVFLEQQSTTFNQCWV